MRRTGSELLNRLLAEQPNTPSELREQLLQMAREWMQAYGRGGWYVYFRRRPRFEDAFTAFAIISASFRPKLLASIGAGASLSWPAIKNAGYLLLFEGTQGTRRRLG